VSAAKPIIVRVTRHFEASAERVFDAWLDPEKARKFLFATPNGEMLLAEIDPRAGGSFNITERRGGQDAEHTGEYLEIDRPRRLVFTMHTEKGSSERSVVSIDIVRQGNGCELTLTHEIDPKWAEYKDRTEAGWTMILQGLAATLV
jgi:uncharacterized protein YndB with AHSA1/START domain